MSHDPANLAASTTGMATGEITDHVYDGIQEYDNPLPGWWTLLFYATILYSVGYGFFAFARPEWTNVKIQYDLAKSADQARLFKALGDLEPDAPTLLAFMHDPEKSKFLTVGQAIFQTNCTSCHNKAGEGNSGPNLTDDMYINVQRIEDLYTVIDKGAQGGAMPAWGNRLDKNEIILAAAYVASLNGQFIDGKAPEGEYRITSWETPTAGAPAND